MESVSGEFAGKVKFVKVDVEDAMDVAVNYQIFGVPTILFFKDGEPVDQLQGFVARPRLVERVSALVE